MIKHRNGGGGKLTLNIDFSILAVAYIRRSLKKAEL